MRRALGVLAVCGVLLSGCSSDESDDAEPRSDESSNTATPTEDGSASEDGSPSPRIDSGLPIPRTYDDALEHFDALGSEPFNVRRFVLPSGNIYCAVKVKGIAPGCEINAGAVKDPAVCAGTPTDQVGRVQFIGGRATPVCNTDTIRQPKAPVLEYGVAARFNNFKIMCLSESIGVTCINTKATEGFFLHRGEYVIFNAG
jgi:hypothetical protein